jgi:hypothetical protein
MEGIRELAERALEAEQCTLRDAAKLAVFALAVLDAAEDLRNDRGPLGTSHVGPMLAAAFEDAIVRRLK